MQRLSTISRGRIGRYANYPAYGIGMLASHLTDDGIDVKILNLNHVVLKSCHDAPGPDAFDYSAIVTETLRNALREFAPDLVGVGCMFSLTHKSSVNICRLAKELALNVPLALGGVHVTNALSHPGTREPFMADLPGVDIFFQGEAELALRDFVRVTSGAAPSSELAQMMLRNGEDLIALPEWKRPNVEDLQKPPALDQLHLPELSSYGKIGGFHYLKAPERALRPSCRIADAEPSARFAACGLSTGPVCGSGPSNRW